MHQCLQCGEVFEHSSKSLLKGCPKCGGTKFFYTKEPLGEEERSSILEEANRDLSGFVEGVIRGGGFFSEDKKASFVVNDLGSNKGKFIELVGYGYEDIEEEAKKSRIEVVGEGIEEKVQASTKIEREIEKSYRKEAKRETSKEDEKSTDLPPGIIDVVGSGIYRIDVDSLMRERAIVIKRKESYFIHLPSAFEVLKRD